MPSTLVLNADRNVRPALGTWIDNNADLLLGFSLRIAEDVLAQLQLQGKASSLNIQPTLAIEKGGDIKHNHLIAFIIFKCIYFQEISNKSMLDITSLIRAKALLPSMGSNHRGERPVVWFTSIGVAAGIRGQILTSKNDPWLGLRPSNPTFSNCFSAP